MDPRSSAPSCQGQGHLSLWGFSGNSGDGEGCGELLGSESHHGRGPSCLAPSLLSWSAQAAARMPSLATVLEMKVSTAPGSCEDPLPGRPCPHCVLVSLSPSKGPASPSSPPTGPICVQNHGEGGVGLLHVRFWGTLSPQPSPCKRGVSGASHSIATGLLLDLVYETRALLLERPRSLQLPMLC